MSEYDVVAFGATGFTGRLVADYLSHHAGAGTRWALAGRNRAALESLAKSLAGRPCPPAGVVTASVDDDASLEKMAASTRVVLTTVGPYAEYGEPVVRACVEQGADYVDITGEPEFVDRMIDRYDAKARDKGLRIVNCCGFDSIPHDLGVMFTVEKLPRGVPLKIEGFVRGTGTFSGGTWQSAVRAMSRFKEYQRELKARRRASQSNGRRVGSTKLGVRYVKELSAWACPLPTIDPQIVQRSARVIERYGPDFRYGHYARIRHATTMVGGAIGIGAIFALAQVGPTRNWLLGLRKSGEGPSAEQRAKSRFSVVFLGEGGGRRVRTEVSGGDPGYGETSKMISESALALAKDRDRLPARHGVLTPAGAMEDVLLDRLVRAGIRFEVVTTE